jgi:DNA repair protein RecO (recombination protein O)
MYLSASKSKMLNDFVLSSYDTIQHLVLTKVERKQLLQSIILFYQLHINTFGEIKSIEVLEEVLS